MRATVSTLGSVVHRRIDMQFLNCFRRGRGQGLTDRAIHRCAGLNLARLAVVTLTHVHCHSPGRKLAGRLSIEYVVRIDAVEREVVARVTLSVGPDALVSEARVGPSRVQQVGIESREKNGELSEAARTQR